MTTTTEITTLNLDLTTLAGDYADGYDMDAANAEYRDAVEAIAQQEVPSVTLHGLRDQVVVIADWDEREAASRIDWDGIEDQVAGFGILAANELHVVTTILVYGAEQVDDREPITRRNWEAGKGTTLSIADTGGEPGQAYRVELIRGSGPDAVVIDSYETTTQ